MLSRKIMPIVLASGLVFTGCSKDEMESPNSSQPPSKTEQNHPSKSSLTDEEKVAMAANVKSITYVSGSEYDVVLWDVGGTTYTVDIQKWDVQELVELSIDDGSTVSTSKVDVDKSEIDIQNDKKYSFSTLETDSLHAGSSVLFRVTLSVISHHNRNARTSDTFANNGNIDIWGDEYPGACFWCTTYEEVPYAESLNLCVASYETEILWGVFSDSGTCNCTFACGNMPDDPCEC